MAPLTSSRLISRRRFLGAIGLGTAGVVLAACAQAAPTAPQPTSAPTSSSAGQPTAAAQPTVKPSGSTSGQPKTKVLIGGWQNAPIEGEIMLGAAKRFPEVEPTIEVETLLLPGTQYRQKILTMMASNTAPDICQFTPDEFPDYAARGALRSLEPYIKEDKVFKKDDYWEPLIKAYAWKGQQGAVPVYNSTYVLFYNKTMFDKAGVKYPDDTWTWHEQFIDAGKALTKEGQFGFGFGTGTGVTSAKYWGDGAEIFDAEYTKSLFDSAEAIKAIQEYADLRNVHKIAPSPAQAGDLNNDTLFATGRVGMYLVGQWVMNNLIQTKGDWEFDVALQPKGRQRRMARLGGGGYTMTIDSKNPPQAWKLLSWMGGQEVQTSWAKAGLQPPAMKKIALSQDYLSIRPPEHVQIFIDQTNYSRTMYPGLPGNAEWNQIVNSQLDPVWLGQAKAADVLPKVKQDLDKWLKELKRDEWKNLV